MQGILVLSRDNIMFLPHKHSYASVVFRVVNSVPPSVYLSHMWIVIKLYDALPIF